LWDVLLTITEQDPDFHFLMDGQTVVIDDYLAIRPQARARVERAIGGGQIQVGPWYTLPDEFLVSAETLVRDLQRGIADGDRYGGAMRAGYLPDSFGHAAQMPQIYRQLGFHHAVVWRGVPAVIDRLAFTWRAPDGSEVLAAYMGTSYSHGVDLPLDGDRLAARLRATVDALQPFQAGARILVMNGNDHVLPQAGLTAAARVAGDHLGWRVQVARLDEYLASLPEGGWPRWSGELRASSRANVLMGTLSTRIPDKQAYFEASLGLERRAEPLCALSGFDAEGFLREAWTLILQNAAHDTACGSGIDAVAAEARLRSEAVTQIANAIAERARAALLTGVSAAPPADDPMMAPAVWNPSPFTRREPIEVDLATVPGGGQDLGPAPIGRRALIMSPPVPGCGVGVVSLHEMVPLAAGAAVRVEAMTLANEHVRCELADDGSISLHHLLSDTRYQGLHHLMDQGDGGDEYNFSPVGDETMLRPSTRLQARVIEQGPLRGTIEATATYRIPAALASDRQSRLASMVDLPVRLRITLCTGQPRLDFDLELGHQALDHRLRVGFPLPFAAARSDADTPYHVTRRAAAAIHREPDAPESELPTYPMRTFVDASDERRGLALITIGLHEYELIPQTPPLLALTLVRAVGWLSRDDLSTRTGHAGPSLPTPGAQVPGTCRFRYSLFCHAGDWETGGVWRAAEATVLPLEVIGRVGLSGRVDAPSLTITPEAVQMTACVPRRDGFDLRIVNASTRPTQARLILAPPALEATSISLGGVEGQPLEVSDGALGLPMRAWEIATIRIRRPTNS
jgi:mannosylglycerate hydrolase